MSETGEAGQRIQDSNDRSRTENDFFNLYSSGFLVIASFSIYKKYSSI